MNNPKVQFEKTLIEARQSNQPQLIVDLIPYSSFIGANAQIDDDDIVYWLDRRSSNIGNPSIAASYSWWRDRRVFRALRIHRSDVSLGGNTTA